MCGDSDKEVKGHRRNVVCINGELFAIDPGLVLVRPTCEETAFYGYGGEKKTVKTGEEKGALPF